MRLFDVFSDVPAIEADDLRKKLDAARAGEITLIDVREPGEYEQEHIPGATLISLSRLPERMDEIDRTKPVVTY